MDLPRIGIIGAGEMGMRWARILSETKVEGWVCDRNRVPRIKAETRYDIEAFEEPQWDDCDGVVIATPVSSHFDLVSEAFERGKHVLVERPVTLDSDQTATLVGWADNDDLVLLPAYYYLYADPIYRMMDWVDQVGTIRRVEFQVKNDRDVEEDVGVLWGALPDVLPLLFSLTDDRPEEFTAFADSCFLKERPDVADIRFEYENGETAQISLNWAYPEKTVEFVILGDEGRILCRPNEGEVKFWPDAPREQELIHGMDPVLQQFQDFVHCIMKDDSPIADKWLAVEVSDWIGKIEKETEGVKLLS